MVKWTSYHFVFENSYEKPPAVVPPMGDDLMLDDDF